MVGSLRTDVGVRAASLDERRTSLIARLTELDERLERDVEQRAAAEGQRIALDRRAAVLANLTVSVERRAAVVDLRLADVRERRRRQSQAAQEITQRLDSLRRRRGEAEKQLEELRSVMAKAEVEEAELRTRLQATVDRLRSDHDLAPDVAVSAPCPELSDGIDPGRRVDILESELDIMGPVNPLALEEYQALQERHSFLQGQLDDRLSGIVTPAAGRDGAVAQGEARNVSVCDGREGLNLKGEVLNDGNELIKGKAEDCCWECKQDPRCNVWVYCEGDCVDFAYHSCWLKRAAVVDRDTPPDAWAANPDVPWTSGWFPPKREAQAREAPPAPGDAAQETREGETSEADAPRTPPPPVATPAPTIRVVPVGPRGAVQPPAPAPAVSVPPLRDDAGTSAFRAPETRGGPPEAPPSLRAPRAPPAAANVTLVPGEPAVIPDSVITILPGEVAALPSPASGASADETRGACGEDAVAVCPSSAADPLAAADIRGSFQLLRERREPGSREDEEASSADASSSRLTLLRPNDVAREIFVTGTLINAGGAPACVGGLELAFDFPRTVVDPDTGRVVTAPPEDFVVQCYYVGVRSREASAAPGPAGAEPSARERAGASAPPRACDEVVTLRMTETGPVAAFKEDVELCPGCWLVGGRDGVLFSWKHRDAARFAMAARFGDAVGYAGARCASR